ncbi:MAG: hypothetical protein EU548_05285 [Promethearchaeota archaeon]|nr:MAG: hypothetical protein EU548_05285 [Candidatus Lokiarchaeota archaeon]
MPKIETKLRYFLSSTLIVICLTMLLTLIPVWQLIIIPGIVAGFLNKQLRYAIFSGLIGVTLSWSIYVVFAFVTRNTYVILEQVGSLIVGSGFGWLILLIVLLIGLLMGALGGGLGYFISLLLKPCLNEKIRKSN